ncbi:MAG TPA: aminoacetone oxidase family FAD-binding enzyme [Phycisphaerales bacterium]|nr:aminoacetone oxidase family FAD-binding enzyme [Phycisphaerales bacterium]
MHDAPTPAAEITVIGAGAAGLFAAIWAGRTLAERGAPPGRGSVIALDGAARLGAKILVAGGGRCNVTHHEVSEQDYAGSTAPAIRNVLARFPVTRTVEFFRDLGVELKREETGKLFPTTDDAHTVLDALMLAVREAGAEVIHPWRVGALRKEGEMFVIDREGGGDAVHARRVILATGGMALPKTGSDGKGYEIARALGHTTTPRIVPALVPLKLPQGHWVTTLSGVSTAARVEVRSSTGRRLKAFTNSLLLTHFGLSGPAALDISRFLSEARASDAGAGLFIHWLPGLGEVEQVDAALVAARDRRVLTFLAGHGLPERLASAVAESAGADPRRPIAELPRGQRRALAGAVASSPVPVVGDRGFLFAEVTAGGVPLKEVRLETMESRVCPGLHLCGEILDVDGRIGGFNFQWAWASGFVAGRSAASGP